MNTKSILKITAIVLISTISAFAKLDTGKMVITWKSGKVTSKTVKLEKVDEKTNRFKRPIYVCLRTGFCSKICQYQCQESQHSHLCRNEMLPQMVCLEIHPGSYAENKRR